MDTYFSIDVRLYLLYLLSYQVNILIKLCTNIEVLNNKRLKKYANAIFDLWSLPEFALLSLNLFF